MKKNASEISSFVAGTVRRVNWPGLLFCCSPLLIFFLIIFCLKSNPFHWVPLWSDEVWWYTQVDSVVNYGMPLGFTGYNETHAPTGTFGFWGGAMVYAMAFFAKIFGWHHYSPLFMNVFYMTVANCVFFILTRPSKAVALKLAFLNCVLFVSIYYMFTGMSECTRFSMAVILAGIFCFLFKEGNKDRKSYAVILYVVTPVVLVFFANCYNLFAILFPLYGYALYRRLSPDRQRALSFVVLCVVVPAVATAGCLLIQSRTSAPYPNTIQNYFNQPNLVAALKAFCMTVARNVRHADPVFVVQNAEMANGYISAYLLFYYSLTAFALFKLMSTWRTSKRMHPLEFLVVYALVVFVVAFLALYTTGSAWTYMRGLNVAFVFSLYIACFLEWGKMGQILVCLAFMQFLPFTSVVKANMAERNLPKHKYGVGHEMFGKYASLFSARLHVSETQDRWENTYALYGPIYNFYCMVPSGLGQNCIWNGRPATQPRYIIADKKTRLTFKGYRNTYSDDVIRIFEKEPAGKESEK